MLLISLQGIRFGRLKAADDECLTWKCLKRRTGIEIYTPPKIKISFSSARLPYLDICTSKHGERRRHNNIKHKAEEASGSLAWAGWFFFFKAHVLLRFTSEFGLLRDYSCLLEQVYTSADLILLLTFGHVTDIPNTGRCLGHKYNSRSNSPISVHVPQSLPLMPQFLFSL